MYIILSFSLLVVVYVIIAYNRFVRQSFLVDEAWSGIDVQLKRRYDLVPSLIEIVKGYALHEQQTLQAVVDARNQAVSDSSQEGGVGSPQLVHNLKQLLVLSEAYPELRADENFRKLHGTLVEIEDELQYARRYYNGTVRDFNMAVLTFPNNLFASLFGFLKKDFFEVEFATERKNPDVSF
ncbi:MAG: LemA family protein [Bdellovibrionales bacterium]|nr:LemA family protein [Bdellovibrionales bacterium]